MKKKMILSIIMVFLFSLLFVPSKIYAEELEVEAETLGAISISFDTEEEFISYIETYGISLRAGTSDKLSYTISFSKSSTEVYITVNAQSVGGYASKVGMKNISVRAYTSSTSTSYVSQSVEGFYSTNTYNSACAYTITNPVAGKAYQIVGTLYTIIDNVEYTYYIESSKYTF